MDAMIMPIMFLGEYGSEALDDEDDELLSEVSPEDVPESELSLFVILLLLALGLFYLGS